MKSLHMSWMWLALLAAPLSALGEPDYQTPPGWRTECMGRVQFDVPKEIAWHLAGATGKSRTSTPCAQPSPRVASRSCMARA